MKKLLVGATSVAILLSSVIPAFAGGPGGPGPMPKSGNVATVTGNTNLAVANSGLNGQTASAPATQDMTTGVAVAEGSQYIVANVDACGCHGKKGLNVATVEGNTNLAVANSGLNTQDVTGAGPTVEYRHRHSQPSEPTSQTMVTNGAGATGTQWVVTNVSMGGMPSL